MQYTIKMFVILLLFPIIMLFSYPAQALKECQPGKITGISCPTPAEITQQYNFKIEDMKHRLIEIQKENTLRVSEAKLLISKNIASSRNSSTHQISTLRNNLQLAKQEAKAAPLSVQKCILKQDAEIAKIHINSLQECNSASNFTLLETIKMKFNKLEQTVIGLIPHCLFLNPLLDEDLGKLKHCIETKINEIKLQIPLIQKQFDSGINEIIHKSVECILSHSNLVSEKIGKVLGAVGNCKDIVLLS